MIDVWNYSNTVREEKMRIAKEESRIILAGFLPIRFMKQRKDPFGDWEDCGYIDLTNQLLQHREGGENDQTER